MASGGQTGLRKILSSRGFRRLLIGQGVSGLGDWVATLAFIALAYQLTGSQTAVAIVLVLRLVPPIFAAPVGGVLADRASRRLIMVTCDLVRAGLIVIVPFVGIVPLYLIAFAHECISLLFLPARDASIPLLLEGGEEDLPVANGLVLGSSFGSIPFAAGLFGGFRLLATHLPSWFPFHEVIGRHPTSFAFFFDAFTFLVSATMIAGISIPQTRSASTEGPLTGIVEGFRYMLRDPLLRSLSSGLVVSMFGGGVLFSIGIAYIHHTLGAGDAEFGWLAALWGVGMGLGLGAVRLAIRERGEPFIFLAAVTLCGAVLIVMALVPQLWLAFVMAIAFGGAFSMAITVALSMAQRVTEDRIRGRIMAAVQMLFRVGLGAGALGIGAIAHAVGRVRFIITLDGNQVGMLAGGGLILAGAFAAAPILRNRRPLPNPAPEAV